MMHVCVLGHATVCVLGHATVCVLGHATVCVLRRAHSVRVTARPQRLA